MFEKEAEEYSEKDLGDKYISSVVAKDKLHAYKLGQYDGFVAGAEFGYNKANEWHYVKDGDLPKDDKQYLVLFFYNYKGKKEMSFGVRDNLHSDFEIHRCYTEQIIAWKEIVLPKESE